MITVEWPESEETYIIKIDGTFIHDDDSLHEALKFALAVGDEHSEIVSIQSIGPKEGA